MHWVSGIGEDSSISKKYLKSLVIGYLDPGPEAHFIISISLVLEQNNVTTPCITQPKEACCSYSLLNEFKNLVFRKNWKGKKASQHMQELLRPHSLGRKNSESQEKIRNTFLPAINKVMTPHEIMVD